MKRLNFWVAAAAVMVIALGTTTGAQGQGFLRNLRDRVAGAAENAILGPEQPTQQQAPEQQIPTQAPASYEAAMQSAMGGTGIPAMGGLPGMAGMDAMSAMGAMGAPGAGIQTAPERISPTSLVRSRLAATASWDDVITPAGGSSADELIRQLPALPTVADLVNPDAARRENYYRQIAAINLRVEQLSQQATCSEGEVDAFLQNVYNEQAARLGITAAELRALDSGTLSEAEEQALQNRIVESLTGGNLAGIMAMASEAEAMAGPDGELSEEQAMALFQKHQASLNLGEMMAAGQQYAAAAQRQSELYQRMAAIEQRMVGVTAAVDYTRYASIAGKYDADLGAMYNQLCAAGDAAAVNAIYERADALVRSYRQEAATAWLAELQSRMEALAGAYPELGALEADMVAEGLMAPCMQRVASLNIVSRFANLLDGAYRDFPQNEMLPVCREVILELPENETLYAAESGFATSVDSFLEGSEILVNDSTTGQLYVYQAGRKRALGPDEQPDFAPKTEQPKPAYGQWSSANGQRSADYQRDGALMLHDGTIFYPLALEAQAGVITWISQTDNRIEKCTYKL